jgi:hypothetical protein
MTTTNNQINNYKEVNQISKEIKLNALRKINNTLTQLQAEKNAIVGKVYESNMQYISIVENIGKVKTLKNAIMTSLKNNQ